MKKLTNYPLLFLCLSLFYFSCEEQNPELDAINKIDSYVVEDGRLIFDDKLAFQKTLSEFNQYSLEDLQAWEKEINGFKSLRSTFNDMDSARRLPVSISTIINEAGVFQVGDTIVLLDGEAEYLIPKGDVKMLQQIQKSISDNLEIDDERFVKRIVRAQSIPIVADEKQNSDNALNWLDAKYQYQFSSSAGERKFVYEVNVWDHLFWIYLEVRSKFEYKGSKGWKAAGETVEKSINNLYIRGVASVPEGPFNLNYPYIYQSNGNNLVVFHAFGADYISDLEVGGSFYSKVMSGHFVNKTYSVPNAYWYKSLLTK